MPDPTYIPTRLPRRNSNILFEKIIPDAPVIILPRKPQNNPNPTKTFCAKWMYTEPAVEQLDA